MGSNVFGCTIVGQSAAMYRFLEKKLMGDAYKVRLCLFLLLSLSLSLSPSLSARACVCKRACAYAHLYCVYVCYACMCKHLCVCV